MTIIRDDGQILIFTLKLAFKTISMPWYQISVLYMEMFFALMGVIMLFVPLKKNVILSLEGIKWSLKRILYKRINNNLFGG